MSYIVKNCPAYDYDEEYNDHICKQPLIPYECNVDDCQDCTDCAIKQVIEKCKDKIRIYECYNTDYALGKVKCAESILDLFDIEEIRE